MLQLKSVQKQFKGNEVLKGVDMQILPEIGRAHV